MLLQDEILQNISLLLLKPRMLVSVEHQLILLEVHYLLLIDLVVAILMHQTNHGHLFTLLITLGSLSKVGTFFGRITLALLI